MAAFIAECAKGGASEADIESAEKMDLLYVAFLSRHPNRDERLVLDQVIRDRGDKAVADVTHALLTGSQFLFIQ